MLVLRFTAAIVLIALGSGCAVTQVQTDQASIALKPATEPYSAPVMRAADDPASATAPPLAAEAARGAAEVLFGAPLSRSSRR